MIELDTLQELVASLQQSGYHRIGVDGVDGCGKTTLAARLAAQLDVLLISLDDFLDKNRGGYLGHLRYEELKREIHAKSPCVVEGVCLLQALDVAGFEIDALVYVKRMQLEFGRTSASAMFSRILKPSSKQRGNWSKSFWLVRLTQQTRHFPNWRRN